MSRRGPSAHRAASGCDGARSGSVRDPVSEPRTEWAECFDKFSILSGVSRWGVSGGALPLRRVPTRRGERVGGHSTDPIRRTGIATESGPRGLREGHTSLPRSSARGWRSGLPPGFTSRATRCAIRTRSGGRSPTRSTRSTGGSPGPEGLSVAGRPRLSFRHRAARPPADRLRERAGGRVMAREHPGKIVALDGRCLRPHRDGAIARRPVLAFRGAEHRDCPGRRGRPGSRSKGA